MFLITLQGQRKNINRDELKPTTQALEKVEALCSKNKSSSELIGDINTLFQNIRQVCYVN